MENSVLPSHSFCWTTTTVKQKQWNINEQLPSQFFKNYNSNSETKTKKSEFDGCCWCYSWKYHGDIEDIALHPSNRLKANCYREKSFFMLENIVYHGLSWCITVSFPMFRGFRRRITMGAEILMYGGNLSFSVEGDQDRPFFFRPEIGGWKSW